ncbi:MAG: hypothetical protein IKP19_01785 [Oscillospiraceae bacterium]|nr:hypothetical protein [Oscillospiraceae bacterium]
MKLFGNRDAQKQEEPEVREEALEKAEAIANSGLVLSIEGLHQESDPEEQVQLSMNTEPFPEQNTTDEEDDFLKELHELLDEKEKSESEPEPAAAQPAAEEASAPESEEAAAIDHVPEAEPVEAPAAEEETESDPEPTEPVYVEEPAAETQEPAAEAPAEAESSEAPEKESVSDTKSFASVSYASMAEAMEQTGRLNVASPTRKTRSAIDDETLLAEIYTLMGETPKTNRTRKPEASEQAAPEMNRENEQAPVHISDDAAPVVPAPQGMDEPTIRPNPIGYAAREAIDSEPVQNAAREGGAPGWLKGLFLLILSAALSGMTLYAVMMDVFGKVF